MAATHIYRQLDVHRKEIRLLRQTASPGSSRASDWTFQHAALIDESPVYDAISYTWGTSSRRDSIILDNVSVSVPASAAAALRCISNLDADVEHVVWLDAVCVNQADIVERGQQVSLMGDLYSRARRVIICLGEDEGDVAESAVRGIRQIAAQCRRETDDLRRLNDHLWTRDHGFKHHRFTDDPLPDCDWSAVKAFYQATWFTRLWVVQETILAREALCIRGRCRIDWPDVALAARWMHYKRYFRPEYCGEEVLGVVNSSVIWDRMATAGGQTLYNLLQLAPRFQTTYAHDRVFALLGLATKSALNDGPNGLEQLQPDYRAPPADLYTLVTRAVIAKHGKLHIVRQAHKFVTSECDTILVPSWVPRYDGHYSVYAGSPSAIRGHGADNDLKQPIGEWLGSGCSGTIGLQGLVVDEILQVSSMIKMSFVKDFAALAETIVGIWTMIITSVGNRSQLNNLEILQLTLFGSTSIDSSCSFKDFIAWCQALVEHNDVADEWQTYWLYIQALLDWAANRVIFVTRTGLLGLGPRDTAVDDCVCIVFGGAVPFIMKRDVGFWLFVGDAYLHSLMDVSCAAIQLAKTRLGC